MVFLTHMAQRFPQGSISPLQKAGGAFGRPVAESEEPFLVAATQISMGTPSSRTGGQIWAVLDPANLTVRHFVVRLGREAA